MAKFYKENHGRSEKYFLDQNDILQVLTAEF